MSVRTWHAPDSANGRSAAGAGGARTSAPVAAPTPPRSAAPPARSSSPLDDPVVLRAWVSGAKIVVAQLRGGGSVVGRLLEVTRYTFVVREDDAKAPTVVMKHAVDVIRMAETG